MILSCTIPTAFDGELPNKCFVSSCANKCTPCPFSGNTYTANGAAEMIKEIVANVKADDLEIMFRMDSGYFDEEIIKTIETLGCKYLIKGKAYPTLLARLTGVHHLFVKGQVGRETTEVFTKLNN